MKDLVFLELITDNYYYKEKAFKGLTREIKSYALLVCSLDEEEMKDDEITMKELEKYPCMYDLYFKEIKNKYYYDYDVNNNNEVVFEYVED